MKIKNKIMLITTGMLVIVMLISTLGVAFLINKQNKEASHTHLSRSFNIISERLSAIQEKLLADGKQMAAVDDMGAKIQFTSGEKNSDNAMLAESTYIEIANALYNMALSSNVRRVLAYDIDGDLVSFVGINGSQATLGFPLHGEDKAAFRIATMKTGKKPESDAWQNADSQGLAPLKYSGQVAKTPETQFEVTDGPLTLTAYVPSMALEFNLETETLEPAVVGIIIAEREICKDFIGQATDLTQTAINIFTREGLCGGTLPAYKTLSIDAYADQDTAFDLVSQKISYSDVSIEDEGYFQGVLPIYAGKKCVAAIASLYSKQIAQANAIAMIKMLCGLSLACILVFLPVTYLFAKTLSTPIVRVREFAGKLEKGDLSERLPTGKDEIGEMGAALNAVVDELQKKADVAMAIAEGDLQQSVNVASIADVLGQALGTMVEQMNNTIVNIQEAADQVDSGSRQISDSSNSLSQGATEQASSLEEISSSVTEIGSQTKTNAENAAQANQLATAAKDDSAEGVRQMQTMTTAMDAINDSSREISKIIKAIDDIAFQTNLLALNAAVEAARAGKHGKGFAVVAQEVRSLAARSAKAAQETADLIEGAIKKADDGNTIVERTASALEKINTGITKVADLVGEIASASDEQAKGVAQVSQGLSQIDSVTQQNTANAEETSAAAQELARQAENVRNLLAAFKVKGDPGRTGGAEDAGLAYTGSDESEARTLLPAQTDYEWGAAPEKEATDHQMDTAPVIALDDDEFGRY